MLSKEKLFIKVKHWFEQIVFNLSFLLRGKFCKTY